MAITIEKKQGIRLPLASAVPTPLHQNREAGGYYKVRSYHGGGEFFQQENAQLILQCLGDFLPRATERVGPDGRMEIFYQHLISGQDVCSRTAPLDSGVNVPASELKRLEAAIAQLKAKESDPGTDPTKREIIRAFRLPSPQKDPELYRLHGSGPSSHLLVLWGVEKEAGSSLPPQEALNQVPQTKRGIPWWLWLLLALLLLALLVWWWSDQQARSALGLPHSSSGTSVAVLVPADKKGTAGTSSPSSLILLPGESKSSTEPAPNLLTGGGVSSPSSADGKKDASGSANGQPSGSSTPDGQKAMAGSPAGGLSGNNGTPPPATGATPVANPEGSKPTLPKKGTAGSANEPPSNSSIPEAKKNMTGSPPGAPSENKGASLPATGAPPAANSEGSKPTLPTSSLPGTSGQSQTPPAATPRDGKPSAMLTANPSLSKDGEPRTSPFTTTTRRSTTLPDEPKKDEPPRPEDPKPTPPGQMPAAAPFPSPATAPGTPSTSLGTPAARPAPLSAEIVNARTSAVPKDGKVEMQLSALARDENGKAITISKVESWTVDGKQQIDSAGRTITTNGLPLSLTEGIHRVRISGTAEDGRSITAEADVNVDIAVREESAVRVKQISKP